MAHHNEIEGKGEKLAQEFLMDKGCKILYSNWRHQKAEVDIIALDGNILVFVEVKCRSTAVFGEAQNFVSKKKEELFKTAAEAYLEENDIDNEIRFDVIGIILAVQKTKIEHFKDAF